MIDPNTSENLHPTEAIDRGILDMDRGLYCNPRTGKCTVDFETLEPHIIASYKIIRQMRPTLLHTSVWNDQCDLSH